MSNLFFFNYYVLTLTITLLTCDKCITKSILETNMATSNVNNQIESTSECIICGAELNFTASLDIGEILECYECGSELEVFTVAPLVFVEAPTESEDWGQ